MSAERNHSCWILISHHLTLYVSFPVIISAIPILTKRNFVWAEISPIEIVDFTGFLAIRIKWPLGLVLAHEMNVSLPGRTSGRAVVFLLKMDRCVWIAFCLCPFFVLEPQV